ncbi:MAG: glycosyltransferase [Pseudomonadota bacterium]
MGYSSVPYVTYWEHAPGQPMPPYVALALVSIRRVLGGRLLLLTPRIVDRYLGPDVIDRAWGFEPLAFTLNEGVEAIVAKSDFIRMAFVHRYGGIWVDADTLFLRDPTDVVFPYGVSTNLHWYDECLFASLPGNPLLAQALHQGIYTSAHPWGNPGFIKDIVALACDDVVVIPGEVVDPGYQPRYSFANCEVMRRRDVSVTDFLQRDVALIKLYNTYFRRTCTRQETVAEFLAGGTLLANLFLHLEEDRGYWLAQVEQLMADIG